MTLSISVNKLFFVSWTLLLIFPALAGADHPDKSTEFFPKHYVTSKKPKDTPKILPSLSPPTSGTPVATEQVKDPRADDDGFIEGSVEVVKDETVSKTTQIMDQVVKPGIPIKSLGAIINTEDKIHFVDSMKEYNEAITSLNIRPGAIYMVGKPINPLDYFADGLFGPLLSGGGLPLAVFEVPKKYSIKLSPTWIVETDAGEILLEAVPSLRKYLNIRGEFVDQPKNIPQLRATKAPTPIVEMKP